VRCWCQRRCQLLWLDAPTLTSTPLSSPHSFLHKHVLIRKRATEHHKPTFRGKICRFLHSQVVTNSLNALLVIDLISLIVSMQLELYFRKCPLSCVVCVMSQILAGESRHSPPLSSPTRTAGSPHGWFISGSSHVHVPLRPVTNRSTQQSLCRKCCHTGQLGQCYDAPLGRVSACPVCPACPVRPIMHVLTPPPSQVLGDGVRGHPVAVPAGEHWTALWGGWVLLRVLCVTCYVICVSILHIIPYPLQTCIQPSVLSSLSLLSRTFSLSFRQAWSSSTSQWRLWTSLLWC